MQQLRFILSLLLCHCINLVLNDEITIDTSVIHAETNEKFVGVAIDTGVVRRHWEKFHPNSKKVITLASALSPSYLRVGGTDADFLIFSNDGSQCTGSKFVDNFGYKLQNIESTKQKIDHIIKSFDAETLRFEPINPHEDEHKNRIKRDIGYELSKDLTNFTMTASFYDQLHNFVSSVGWELIFDLNSLLRVNGTWNSSNAEDLVNYTASCGYKMAGWELGNEPDEYGNPIIKHQSVPPEQLAQDFLHMKDMVQSYPEFNDCLILGPSIAAMSAYWRLGFFYSFLKSGGGNVVTAATFHQYYENGRFATEGTFYDPNILNVLFDEIQCGVNLTRASGSRAKVWLGETSSAWGGGAVGMSDRYLAGFLWLDKLGMAARDGINTLIRQTFYGGHYALIDSETLNPNPDYWLTLMYKLLVSNKVLHVTSTDSMGTLRVYAHCTDRKKSGYPVGSVTVFVLNLSPATVSVTLPDFQSLDLHVYNMTPTDGDLLSQSVDLNGVTLQMLDDSTLPNLLQPIKTYSGVSIAGRTFSFIVIPEANVSVCS